MAAADFHLIEPLFAKVDTWTGTYVTSMSQNAASMVMGPVQAGLALSFFYFWWGIISGRSQSPAADFIGKCVRVVLIMQIGLGMGFYNEHIAEIIRTTPDGVATALLPDAAAQTAAGIIDHAAGQGFTKAFEAIDAGGLLKEHGVAYWLSGGLILIATAVLVAIGGAFVLLAKFLLIIMAGIGPLFIAGLLFKPTEKFFDAWANVVATGVAMTLMFAASFGFMLTVFDSFASQVAFDGELNVFYTVGGLLVLCIMFVVILLQLPNYAQSLGGGVATGFLSEIRTAAGGAKSAGKASVAGAALAAQGIGKGGAAIGRGFMANVNALDAMSARGGPGGGSNSAGHARGPSSKRAA